MTQMEHLHTCWIIEELLEDQATMERLTRVEPKAHQVLRLAREHHKQMTLEPDERNYRPTPVAEVPWLKNQ